MRLKEIEKLTKRELRQRVDQAFAKADEKGPGYLGEAQFYMRELEHRHDSWISTRDLILEIVVIALIGWEIWMSYRGEQLESQNFEKQQKVFENLQSSSAATAGTLTALQETSKHMNEAVQKELALSYEVSLLFSYDRPAQQVKIVNNSRTKVTLWGYKLGNVSEMFKEPIVMPVGATAKINNKEFWDKSEQEIPREPRNVYRETAFVVYVQSRDGKDFAADCSLFAGWQNGGFNVFISNNSINPSNWSRKTRSPAQ